ncbi:MAG: TolC family protein [Kiritimatiellae bacterium]|nr:TolC family protein [Kiritimatiellia bacterium]
MRRLPFLFLLAVLPAAGCLHVPDRAEMASLRADAAAERLHLRETASPGVGEAPFSGDLPLRQAVDMALARNLAYQKQLLSRDIARGRLLAARTEMLPTLSASGGWTHYDEELRSDAGAVTRFQNQYAASATLSQPLFNARAATAARAASLYGEWVETVIRQSEEQLRFDVAKAYYAAVLSESLLAVQSNSLATAESQLADQRARRRQGMASNYDELRAEVEVANFSAQVLSARDARNEAYTALHRLLKLPSGSDTRLVDGIPLVLETIDFAPAVLCALSRRSDLAAADWQVRLQHEAVENAKASYFPGISAFFTEEAADPAPKGGGDKWGDQWKAGINASWTLFDGFSRRGELIQARAQERQLALALQDAEEAAESEVRQMVLTLRTAEEFAKSQSKNLETAKEALRLVQTGLREGQNTQVEVMDAREALSTAAANYYRSIYDHAIARMQLQKAMGLIAEGPLPDEPVLVPPGDLPRAARAAEEEE